LNELTQRAAGADGGRFWIPVFLLPFLLLYGGFTLWPLLATLYYSLFNWDGIRPLNDFVGLGNYQRIAGDAVFWLSFKNTLVFAVVETAVKLPLSLLVAILVTRRWLLFKTFFRTVFFLPIILPVALAGLVFTYLLNPANGALDSFLTDRGLIKTPIDLLGHGNTALVAIILVAIWQIFGQYMVYWMAALQNVPEEAYEAADLDGANELQKLIHITLPMIRPVALIISLLALVNALHVETELSVGELVDRVGISYGAVSKQLALLRSHGVLAKRREGTRIFYRITDPALSDLCDAVCKSIRDDWAHWGRDLEQELSR